MTSDDKELIIDFFGDVSLNGLYCDPLHLHDLKVDLLNLNNNIGSSSMKVINWESPISRKLDLNQSKGTLLATTHEAAEVFSVFNPDVAIIGNNHIGDCRNDGFFETTSFFRKKNIEFLGAKKKSESLKPNSLIISKHDVKIGFLSYVGSETNPMIEKETDIEIAYIDKDLIIKEIKQLRDSVDLLIVSLHWGAEFVLYPTENQKKLARALIDSGADIIYGHHSHSLQGMERWNEGVIFYSLGNFIFSGLKGKESYHWPSVSTISGFYRIEYKNGKIDVKFNPLLVSNGVKLLEDDKYAKQHQKASKNLSNNIWIYNIRYKINIAYIWLWILPLFFIKTRGGVIASIRKIKIIHLKLFFNNIFSGK